MSKQNLAEGFGQILAKVTRDSGGAVVNPENPEHQILAHLSCAALIAEKNGYSEVAFVALAKAAHVTAAPKADGHPF